MSPMHRAEKKYGFSNCSQREQAILINKGELASLRTEQDTINIIGILVNPPKPKQKISLTNPRYYHIVFYLNDMGELTIYYEWNAKRKNYNNSK